MGIEELLITFFGRDEVSPVASSIASNTQATFTDLESTANATASNIAGTYNSTFDQIGRGIHTLNMGMVNLSSMGGMLMRELGSTKSAMEWVYGTTSREDTNKVLVSGLGDATESAEDLYATIDKVTDGSLTSMQDLIPAVNAFHSATQASAIELDQSVVKNMADFGAFVLAQTGSTQLSLTAMMDLAKGIKGQFAALDQYGISLASMENTGLWKPDPEYKGKKWKGDEHDVKGYMEAVKSLLGDTDALMNTNEGLNAQMGKMWSRAGKRIGHEMMPGLKSLKQMFIDLDQEMNGDLSTAVLRVDLALEETHQKVYELNTAFDATKNLIGIAKSVLQYFGFFVEGSEMATASTMGNTEALAQNTDMLYQNADAKLYNADATMAMTDAMYANDVANYAPMPNIPANEVAPTSTGGMMAEELGDMLPFMGADFLSDTISNKMSGGNNGPSYQEIMDKMSGAKKEIPLKELEDKMEETAEIDKIIKDAVDAGATANDAEDFADVIRATEKDMESLNIKNLPQPKSSPEEVLADITRGDAVDNTLEGINGDYVGSQFLINKNASMNIPEANKAPEVLMNEKRYEKGYVEGIKNWGGELLESGQDILDGKNQPVIEPTESKIPGAIATTLADNKKGIAEVEKFAEEHNTQLIKTEKSLENSGGFFTRLNKKWNDLQTKGVKNTVEGKGLNLFNISKEKLIGNREEDIGAVSKSLNKMDNGINGMKESYKNINKGFDGFREAETKSGKLDGLFDGIKNIFGKGGASKVVEEGAEEVMETGGKLAQTAGEAGAVGAGMAEAEAGLSFMGLAEMGLAGAFSTLIVPTLAIAGVIAVLIPVIAGLAIEAMLFINLVAQMMEAMNFEDIDLDGAVEGLQSIATALAWLGVAMASLTFASLTSTIGLVTASLFSLIGGIPAVVDLLLQVREEIAPLSDMPDIDDSVVTNLQNLSSVLGNISVAMLSLTAVQIVSGVNKFLSAAPVLHLFFGDGLTRAVSEIQEAINSINSINFSGIDEDKVTKIKNAGDAIKGVSDAFSGLTKIRGDDAWSDFIAWLLDGGFFGHGGKSIGEAFASAQKDIQDASKAISNFTDITDIDQTTVDRLSKVGESIKAMGDAFEGLRKIRDDMNWDENGAGSMVFSEQGQALFDKIFPKDDSKNDLSSAIEKVKPVIENISRSLKTLKIDDIPKDIPQKLQKVTDTLNQITGALDTLSKIKEAGGKKNKNFDDYVETIKTARKSLVKISKELKKLDGDEEGKGGLSTINKGVATKLKQVTKTLENISKAIEGLKGISDNTNKGKDFSDYVEMIKTARSSLVKISNELRDLNGDKNGKGGLSNIDSSVVSKLKTVTTTLKNIAKAVKQLHNIHADSNEGNDFEGYVTTIRNAREGLSKVSDSLKNLATGGDKGSVLKDIPEGLAGKIAKVTTTLKNIAKALTNMRGIYKIGHKHEEGGFKDYVDTINNARTGISEVSASLSQMKLNSISQKKVQQIKKVAKTLEEVNTAIGTMQSMFNQFGGNQQKPSDGTVLNNPLANTKTQGNEGKGANNIENYKQVISDSASALVSVSGELNKLGNKKGGLQSVKGVSNKIKNVKSALSQLSSAGKIMKKFPKMSGDEVPTRVQKAVTALQNSARYLRNINEKDKVGNNVNDIINNIKDAISNLKSALKTMNFKPEGEHIGGKIKSGIGSGLKGLSGTVKGKINASTQGATGAAWNMGVTLGDNMTRGFASALKLVDAINSQILQAQTNISNATAGMNSGGININGQTVGTSGAGAGDNSATPGGNQDASTQTDPHSRGRASPYRNTRAMISSISSNLNNLQINKLNQGRNQSLSNMNKKSKLGNDKQNVNIIVNEGAVQLDARNLTTKESRQVMINALEGLPMIRGINL